ncbi:hypothetical protein [Paenibacillus chitinolyticus]|uniref:hypothetical protein n=1 Tax=Paenibacillus chitinolyticus TaxID=79263 RepID=UPI00362B448C
MTAERRAGPEARAWDSRALIHPSGAASELPRQSADKRVINVMLHRSVHRERSCAALGVTGFNEMIPISLNKSYSVRYINTLLFHFNE